MACDCGNKKPTDVEFCRHPGCSRVGCEDCEEVEYCCDEHDEANGDYFCTEHQYRDQPTTGDDWEE